MNFRHQFLQFVARQSPELRRQVYAIIKSPFLNQQQKIQWIALCVRNDYNAHISAAEMVY